MNAQPKTLTNSQISNMAAMLESSSTPETLKIRFTMMFGEENLQKIEKRLEYFRWVSSHNQEEAKIQKEIDEGRAEDNSTSYEDGILSVNDVRIFA